MADMPASERLVDLLARAVADPGTVTPRDRSASLFGETVVRWGARAAVLTILTNPDLVLAVLTEGGELLDRGVLGDGWHEYRRPPITTDEAGWRLSDSHGLCVVEDVEDGVLVLDLGHIDSPEVRAAAEVLVRAHNAKP